MIRKEENERKQNTEKVREVDSHKEKERKQMKKQQICGEEKKNKE